MRFTDILTTASAVANFLGEPEVTAGHLLQAIEIVEGKRSVEDLGRPLSPLVRRPGGGVQAEVRALVQRWYAAIGGDVMAEIDDAQVAALRAELEALVSEE
ncbi:hypothetical protein AYO38_09415 [bacterium SCGC AG-212-C10]|nr:hypothetical protein AYO38_09415 [bacterium SCGC AG-212-C10]